MTLLVLVRVAHEQWRLSGVGKRSSAAHIHRSVCESLRLLHTYDQTDASTTAVGEHLSRWAIQTALAVRRKPAPPDYAGLGIISGSTLQADGRATTGKFQDGHGSPHVSKNALQCGSRRGSTTRSAVFSVERVREVERVRKRILTMRQDRRGRRRRAR